MGELIRLRPNQQVAEVEDATDVAEEASLAADAARLRGLVLSLPQPQRSVIEWHFGLQNERLTLREVASRLNCSTSRVRRLECSGLELLRREFVDLPVAA